MGLANHPKQGVGLFLTVNHPLRIKNFVTAVLTVGLREHDELNIGWVALQPFKRLHQVIDFID